MTNKMKAMGTLRNPLLGCTAAAMILLGFTHTTDSSAQSVTSGSSNDGRVVTRSLAVDHVRISSNRSFNEVKSALESRISVVDLIRFRSFLAQGDIAGARAYLEQVAGTTGLSIVYALNHGGALAVEGGARKAMSYGIGNILIAASMTKHQLGAGLYAPIRVVLYEKSDGTAVFEYDLPSSTFKLFNDVDIDRQAKQLDTMLLDLLKDVSK